MVINIYVAAGDISSGDSRVVACSAAITLPPRITLIG